MDPGVRPRRRLGIWLRRHRGVLQVGYLDVALELSDPARILFENADGERSVQDLAGLLVAEYEISHDEALADTVEFITSMVDHRLIVLGPGDASPEH